ncbi:MAG: hypothetical protein ACRBN8_23230 [Nannocystales bacterium]
MKSPSSLGALSLTLAFAFGGCLADPRPDPNYCGNFDGDAFCVRKNPEEPYCVFSGGECFEDYGLKAGVGFACVAEPPTPQCHSECGIPNGDSCLDPTDTTMGSSSGSTTEQPSTTGSSTETGDETTGSSGPECTGDAECTDPALAFCVEQVCSTCSAVVELSGDEACAGLDASAPLCVDDACVQCTAESSEACGGGTPVCDAEASVCVPCAFHEECQAIGSPACNVATGACFDPDAVTNVVVTTDGSIQEAVDGVADGEEWAIVLSGIGDGDHQIRIDAGKVIAIVSSDANIRGIDGVESDPTVTVTGDGTTLFLHRVRLALNGAELGISVESGGTLYADNVQVSQNTEGGIQLASGTSGFVRNSMVSGVAGNPGTPAITANGANLEILYSTLGVDFNSGGPVLQCTGGTTVVRNSLIVSETSSAGPPISCSGASITTTPTETTLDPGEWFVGFATGDYTLTAPGQTEFEGLAVWEDGDPPFDFGGDVRPREDGAPDYPGADVP